MDGILPHILTKVITIPPMKAPAEIKILQFRLDMFNRYLEPSVSPNIIPAINSWPASTPRLNENKGPMMFCDLAIKDLSNTEKPNPCTVPKKRAMYT